MVIPTDVMSGTEIRSKKFNADLVLNGYAEPSTYPPDVKYSDVFVQYAKEAREANKGLWAYGANGTTKGDLDPKTVATPAPTPAPSKPSQPAATTPSKPASVTPPPAQPASGGSEFFVNCTELRTKYPNGVPSTHPAYQAKMDRDHDIYACER